MRPSLKTMAVDFADNRGMYFVVGGTLVLPRLPRIYVRQGYKLADFVFQEDATDPCKLTVTKNRYSRSDVTLGLTRYGFDKDEEVSLQELLCTFGESPRIVTDLERLLHLRRAQQHMEDQLEGISNIFSDGLPEAEAGPGASSTYASK